MNMNENVKNEEIIIRKKHKNWFQPYPSLFYVVISFVKQCDKSFNRVVLYGNNLICIFMNINENVKN